MDFSREWPFSTNILHFFFFFFLSMTSNKDSFPLIIFIPVIICVGAILFLLNLRQQQLHPPVTAPFPRSTTESKYLLKIEGEKERRKDEANSINTVYIYIYI
ncbi:hypothetical protein BD770DRAFT_213998 [Pilaira anomala]|nr:hypothetical protein BD770DRAFT_213998 [Pilaira anomala]